MLALSIAGFLTFLQSAIFVVGYISNNTLFPEPLSPQEEKIYLERFKAGEEEARNILIERNLRLVAHVCKKYSSTNVDQDDLISIGTIGLIKGINSFDHSKGIRLATYVSRCIDNEILMFLRSNKKTRSEVYLNEPIGKDKDDNEIALIDILENDERNIEDEIDKTLLRASILKLNEREKDIMEMRFGFKTGKEKTQKEVADELRYFPKLYI